MKNSKWILMLRIIGVLAIIGGLLSFLLVVSKPPINVEKMELIFIKTKDDADCTLLLNRDKVVMIDTGELQDYEHIHEVLNKYAIDKIDCLILTHPDKDHIGSALKIVENYQVGVVIKPYYAKEDERYDTLNRYLEEHRIQSLVLSRNRHLVYGDISLVVYPPNDFEYNNDNNYSLAVKVEHQELTMFFAGDAEKKRTEELLSLSLPTVDLYKASYHGRDYEGTVDLLNVLKPEKVVISAVTAGNELSDAIDAMGCTLYSSRIADVYFVSDGRSIKRVLFN